jgi:DNA helicase II / ATP-dependent DNA helicase PcrA
MIDPTPQQEAIASHRLTPLRVTAGAGTGKTSTLAERVARQIEEESLEPEQVLGITFTNKAAGELADKIRSRLGDVEAGREVEVTTYHGFAYGLVREFGPLAGIPRSARLVTPGYVRQLLRDAIGSSPREHLDLTQAGRIVDRLLSLSSALGDNLLSPDSLNGVGAVALRPARSEIATILQSFQSQKERLGVVDFSDLVRAAHSIVTSHPTIAKRIRQRYRLVLLDEYQDTNPGQRELLLRIFGAGFPVTAVGDSDQTIYEWRGASPENFERFPDHFPTEAGSPAPSLELATCFRSGTKIVDIANDIRSRLTKPGPLPELLPRSDAPSSSVKTHWLHSSVAEARWIADEILRLHSDEGYAWRDMALLFRKHRQMATIRDALANADIPVEVASMGGLLEVPEVTDLHCWLRILGRPDDAPGLMRILLGSRYRLGMGQLAPLATWVRHKRHDADEEAAIGWALLEAVDSLDEIDDLDAEARRRLEAFRLEYRSLLELAQGVSLVELCRRVLDRTGAWQEIEALPGAARVSARLNIHRFLDLAEDWSPLEGGPSLEAFLDHLDVLAEDTAASDLDTANISSEDAVVMLTVHRAKGLEWPIVFLPALTTGTFPSNVIRYEDPLTLPEVLPHELRLDRDSLPDLDPDDSDSRRSVLRAGHLEGEWRTAYVAATRAQDSIVATGAWWYTDGRPRKRSELFELIDSVAEAAAVRVEDVGDAPTTLRLDLSTRRAPDPHFASGHIEALRTAIAESEMPHQMATDAGIVAQYDAAVEQLGLQLEGLPAPLEPDPSDGRFRTSVTGLVTYATCGLRFRWEHIDRLPRRPSAAARRGVELHRKIELHHRGTVAFDDATPDFYDDAIGADETPSPVGSAYDRFLSSRFAEARPIMIETPFELSIGDGSIRGRIDAVYAMDPTGWEIVDFKSGRPSRQEARKVQLEAYAIAANEARLEGQDPPASTTVTFAYFGGDEVVAETEVVDPAWLAAAATHLEDLVAGAANGPYEPQPGSACRYCDFAQFCPAGTAWLEEQP